MHAELDNYAEQYSTLLADPLRDRFASSDFFYRRKLMLIRKFFRRYGLNAKQSSWVDIGCGQGDLLRLGMSEFGSSTGCDVSPAMLRGCRGLAVLRQEQDDVLRFPDGSADFATAVCVYHHLPPSKRAALTREAARVLKPGGTFCIIEHNPVNPVTRLVVNRSPLDIDAPVARSTTATSPSETMRLPDCGSALLFVLSRVPLCKSRDSRRLADGGSVRRTIRYFFMEGLRLMKTGHFPVAIAQSNLLREIARLATNVDSSAKSEEPPPDQRLFNSKETTSLTTAVIFAVSLALYLLPAVPVNLLLRDNGTIEADLPAI